MDHMLTLFPPLRRLKRLPFSRDQLVLLMVAVNELFLALDIYLAHNLSGTIVPREWIPIIFGTVSGTLLLILGVAAKRYRTQVVVSGAVIFISSIIVGLLGAYYHWIRAILPAALPGERISSALLVWAPPVLAPLTFALVGVLGLSSLWNEDPADSGRLRLTSSLQLTMPLSRTRALFFLVGLGSLATLLSSVLDHARAGFDNPWLWIPILVGVLGSVVAVYLGMLKKPHRVDLIVYVVAMGLMALAGVIGLVLHIDINMTAAGEIVTERFIRGAPFLAPLLFANMGAFGLIILFSPEKEINYED